MTSLYCPSSKDNDPEYVCTYCRKICTTKALLKLNLKATQHHSHDVIGEDESEAKNVDEVEDAPVTPHRPCLISCMKIFLMKTFLFCFFIIATHSMQGCTTTTRHGASRKRNIKRLRHTGNLFRKNLQLKDVY